MKKNRLKIVFALVICSVILGCVLFFYVYKGHRDIGQEKASFSISVEELHKQFQLNDSLANASYADQTILVSGLVTSIDKVNHAVILNGKLFLTCTMDQDLDLQLQQSVKFKGRFVGYDDLMEELKMDQCVLIK
jgi:tRNA_anti-like